MTFPRLCCFSPLKKEKWYPFLMVVNFVFVFKHESVVCVWNGVILYNTSKMLQFSWFWSLAILQFYLAPLQYGGGWKGRGGYSTVFNPPPPSIPTVPAFYPRNLIYKLDLDAKQWIGMCTSLDDSSAIAPALMFSK